MSNSKIKLTKDQIDLLFMDTTIKTDKEDQYFYLPFWFKKEKDKYFTILSFKKLPKDLIEEIDKIKNATSKERKLFFKKLPYYESIKKYIK